MPQNIFKILDGRGSFWQWDVNQRITADWLKVGDIIHVTNDKQPTAPMLKAYDFNGTVVVDVPNILLQDTLPISAYRYIEDGDAAATINKFIFKVRQRPRPDGYVYTETETLTYHQLDERITYLEENGTGGGGGSKITVDQVFTPTSKNPQSGIAVAEALGNIDQLVIDAGVFRSMEDLQRYKFEAGKIYILYCTDNLNNINMHGEFIGTVCENILYCFRSSLSESLSIDLTKGEVVDYYNSAEHPFETCDIYNYEELLGYPFKVNKLYKLNVITNLHSLIPTGCYIGRYFYDKDVWNANILEFTTFIPDGKVRVVNFETEECLTRDVDVVKSVNGKTGEVQLTASDVGALSENDIKHVFLKNDKKPISSVGVNSAINLVVKKSTDIESFARLFYLVKASSFDPCFLKAVISNDLRDAVTYATLPKGTYLCVASNENNVGCWDIETQKLYTIRQVFDDTINTTTYTVETGNWDIIAEAIRITDIGEYFEATTVEDALQEIGKKIEDLGTSLVIGAGEFGSLTALKEYDFDSYGGHTIFICDFYGVLPNGLRDFGTTFVKYTASRSSETEYWYRYLNCYSVYGHKKANINLLTDEVTVVDYEEKITNIENILDELGTLENGKSAYEIAMDNGFEGDEAEWLESLKGEDGLTPFINDNGNWQIGDTDTGVKAEGDKGDAGIGIDEVYILDGNLYVKKTTDTEAINLGSVKGDPATNLIQSVNGYTGVVQLNASDVKAVSSDEGTQMKEQIQTINTTLQGLEDFLASI